MCEEPIIWINGDLKPASESSISAFDLGVSVGLGVFETLIAYRGVMPHFALHYQRLKQSAKLLQLTVPDQGELQDAALAVIAENKLNDEERVRIRVTLGAGKQSLSGDVSDGEPYLIISAVEQLAPALSAELILVPMRLNEHSALAGIKSISYAGNILAYRHALSLGADEAVMLNTSGLVSECSMSNIFIVRGGEVSTPPLSSGCLPGVTRGCVIDLCQQHQIAVSEIDLKEGDLLTADEIFITSSARGVQPARMLGSDVSLPGTVTQQLASAYQESIAQEINR